MQRKYRVNALNGLTSFLQGNCMHYIEITKCVNALNGLTSFLLEPKEDEMSNYSTVSTP